MDFIGSFEESSPEPPPIRVDSEKIQEFIPRFLLSEKIFTRKSLDEWCDKEGAKKWGDGYRRNPLYIIANKTCPSEYARLIHPNSTIRATYELYLEGFKIKSKNL